MRPGPTSARPAAAGPPGHHRRVALAAFLAWWPCAAQPQPTLDTMRSVVRVSCDLPAAPGKASGGVMKASGFVWPKEMQVVTALHAVAGCTRVSVFSEATKSTSPASLGSVLLEGDLALLNLDKSLGVAPARAATQAPDIGGRFDIVGYPWGVDAGKSDPVTFSTGLSGAVITLDSAYGAVPEMRAMFDSKEQPYPAPSALILRIGSPLQPGHSGAPIFDSKGQVAAIADGGLFKGYAGMNWSLPAHVYLPRLQTSKDAKPAKPSTWAVRFSAVAVPPSQPVAVPPEAADVANAAGLSAGSFRVVRRVSLDLLEERLRAELPADHGALGNIKLLRTNLVSAAQAQGLAFDIYEEAKTGATVGVPSQMSLRWNNQLRSLEAVSPDGGVSVQIGVLGAADHENAKRHGLLLMTRKFRGIANWGPRNMPEQVAKYDDVRPPSAAFPGWAAGYVHLEAPDRASGRMMALDLRVAALGKHFMGSSVYAPQDLFGAMSRPDQVAYIMMSLAGDFLFDFARQ